MYYVYVLKSLRQSVYYKGLTNKLERKIEQHLNGEVNSTKRLLPLALIHVELYKDRSDARRMEKFLKSGYGRECIKEIAEVVEWQTRGT